MAKRRRSRAPVPRARSEATPVQRANTRPERPPEPSPVDLAGSPRDPRRGGTRALIAVGLTYAVAFGIWFLATWPEAGADVGQPRPPASYVVSSENTGSVRWWRVPTAVPTAALPPPPVLGGIAPSSTPPPGP